MTPEFKPFAYRNLSVGGGGVSQKFINESWGQQLESMYESDTPANKFRPVEIELSRQLLAD
jgi:hypothetical protein